MVALPELIPLAALIIVVGLILLIEALVKGLFHPLTSLPVVGGAIRSAENAIVHSLNSALGLAVSGIEHIVGASWHSLSRFMDWLWREIRSHADLIAYLATPIGSLLLAYNGIKGLVHDLTRTRVHSDARLKAVTRELGRLERREKTLEHDLTRGIGEDVLPRIKALDREIAKIRTQTIPAIREADNQAAGAISNLYEWAKGKASLLGVGTFSFAIASVIGIDVFNWLKCNSTSSLARKFGCGFWKWIEDALAIIATLALAAFSVLKPQDLAEAAVAAVDTIEPILTEILNN